jgi:hypothetical protein
VKKDYEEKLEEFEITEEVASAPEPEPVPVMVHAAFTMTAQAAQEWLTKSYARLHGTVPSILFDPTGLALSPPSMNLLFHFMANALVLGGILYLPKDFSFEASVIAGMESLGYMGEHKAFRK